MAYVKQTWINGSAGGTPLSAARLSHLEDGLEAAAAVADTAVAESPRGASFYGIPTLKIDIADNALPADTENYLAATFELNGATYPGEIRGRGNSTWLVPPKKPYRIKLTTAASLAGMPANRHWALLANYFDDSMIRNAVAFEVGALMTGLEWTPRYQYVDVVLNGYCNGLYQLTEHVRFDAVRVPHSAASGTTGLPLTGAYLLEIDHAWGASEPNMVTTHDSLLIVTDDPDGTNATQMSYITDWMDNFETVLYDDGLWLDPDDGYAQLIDRDSFIDWYLASELLVSQDGMFWSSCKLYKTRDTASTAGKLFLGPLWDFDLSMGVGFGGEYSSSGWWVRGTAQPSTGDPVPGATWIVRMLDDPDFLAAVVARWDEVAALLADVDGIVDSAAQKIAVSRSNDTVIWPDAAVGHAPWRGVADDIKTWLTARITWISENIGTPEGAPPDPFSVYDWHEGSGSTTTSTTVDGGDLTANTPGTAWNANRAAGQFSGEVLADGSSSTLTGWSVSMDVELATLPGDEINIISLPGGIYCNMANDGKYKHYQSGESTSTTGAAVFSAATSTKFTVVSSESGTKVFADGVVIVSNAQAVSWVRDVDAYVMMNVLSGTGVTVDNLKAWPVTLTDGEVALL